MLFIIAWRNIWRNKIRSLVVMASIAVGIWAGLAMMSFSYGMYQGHIRNVILYQLSHLQLHHPGFRSELNVVDTIGSAPKIEESIRQLSTVKAVSRRCVSRAMLVSASGSAGVVVNGVAPDDEKLVTGLDSSVISGDYFHDENKKELLIGSKLAEKLHVKPGSKLVVMMQDANGEMVSGAFRVKGVFRTRNSEFDEGSVFISIGKWRDMASLQGHAHEIAVLLYDGVDLLDAQGKIKSIAPNAEVLNWMEMSPELDLVVNSFDTYMYIFMGIILAALMFGIVNTMLMAVLERQREIGMLMAIGMNRKRVFSMIMLETSWLALLGGTLGILLGHLTILWFGTHGVDLSQYSEALSMYGFSNIIYFELDSGLYIPILIMTLSVTMLSAVYPAAKAVSLDPARAIRKI